jgi:L-ascorbate metabolism protein UlaG (beta-lactamase superfamily)
MNLIYHGHSCVQLTDGSNSIIIDPFISGNPLAKTKPEDIHVQFILLTHAHPDHIADAETIARRTGATIVATYELATHYSWKGLQTIGTNIGGTVNLGFAKAKMVQAFHSAGMIIEEEQKIIYMGMPGGFVITWNGLTLLHTGDTSLFGDMKLIGELHDIDYALLPIGDLLTMGPDDALIAAEWLQARNVIPIHHSTFPVIAQDADLFVTKLKERGIGGHSLVPGGNLQLTQS